MPGRVGESAVVTLSIQALLLTSGLGQAAGMVAKDGLFDCLSALPAAEFRNVAEAVQ